MLNDQYQHLINGQLGLKKEIIAYQYGYLNDSKITIKEIDMEYFDFIKANYSTKVEDSYLIKRIMANVFVGKQIVGFAGIHVNEIA